MFSEPPAFHKRHSSEVGFNHYFVFHIPPNANVRSGTNCWQKKDGPVSSISTINIIHPIDVLFWFRGRNDLPNRLPEVGKGQTTMIKFISICLAFLFTFSSVPATFAEGSDKQIANRALMHVVCLKFKDATNQAQIDEVVRSFRALPSKIHQVSSFEWGLNVSPEKRNKGFTHCFVLTFKSDKARDEYLVHPEHKAFVKQIEPVVADVFVIDYLASK
jgi:hypothetical protein